ncbi:hypothetical protein CPLU01_10672 [Colletotrichum plurivorum]|uniref:Uncharacterized protein n=1 Tax=Colletotrichum plurivorum TaxID=2175906 RepID=A0A8H6K5D4_9PEZI|nr:hypothetical protein CPLU01_10672 [Colletotrichum plurivorum]
MNRRRGRRPRQQHLPKAPTGGGQQAPDVFVFRAELGQARCRCRCRPAPLLRSVGRRTDAPYVDVVAVHSNSVRTSAERESEYLSLRFYRRIGWWCRTRHGERQEEQAPLCLPSACLRCHLSVPSTAQGAAMFGLAIRTVHFRQVRTAARYLRYFLRVGLRREGTCLSACVRACLPAIAGAGEGAAADRAVLLLVNAGRRPVSAQPNANRLTLPTAAPKPICNTVPSQYASSCTAAGLPDTPCVSHPSVLPPLGSASAHRRRPNAHPVYSQTPPEKASSGPTGSAWRQPATSPGPPIATERLHLGTIESRTLQPPRRAGLGPTQDAERRGLSDRAIPLLDSRGLEPLDGIGQITCDMGAWTTNAAGRP